MNHNQFRLHSAFVFQNLSIYFVNCKQTVNSEDLLPLGLAKLQHRRAQNTLSTQFVAQQSCKIAQKAILSSQHC